jgi:hypothetical protein
MPAVFPVTVAGGLVLARVYWEYSPTDDERAEVAGWVEETDCTDVEFLAIEQTAVSMHGIRAEMHVMVAPRRCGTLTNDLRCALAELRHELRR